MQKFNSKKHDLTRLKSNTKDAYGHKRFSQNIKNEHNNVWVTQT